MAQDRGLAHAALDELLDLGGLPRSTGERVTITGDDPVLPTRYRIGTAGAGVLAATGVAASELWRIKTGRTQTVAVDVPSAAISLRSGRYMSIAGRPADRDFAPLMRFYPTRDGRWLFLHTNFPNLRDQALRLLGDADAVERRVLGAIAYQDNEVVLHTDESFLPRRRSAWSAWNYHADHVTDAGRPVGVSYLINKLQPLPFSRPVIVTLNPAHAPRPECIIDSYRYAHPVFDLGSIAAQARLPGLQGRHNTWFCGAWAGYGFHEDGLKAGLGVAAAFGVTAPWLLQPEGLKAAA
jgi:hypothetical protein